MLSSEIPSTILGGKDNFWLWSSEDGYDLTHPAYPKAPPVYPRMPVATSQSVATIDPTKAALVVVDLQNYFLSPAMGRPPNSLGLQTVSKLLDEVIPACRRAGIRVVWLGWGVTQEDIDTITPAIARGFGMQLDTNFIAGFESPRGLGSPIGPITLSDGSVIDGGRALMRDEWSSQFYPSLVEAAESQDIWIYKNRNSGFWGGTEAETALRSHGIRTLIFSGANTDQCVASSIDSAYTKGWDCLMISDACATTSPDFAKQCTEYECELGWGFVLTCKQLIEGVNNIQTAPES